MILSNKVSVDAGSEQIWKLKCSLKNTDAVVVSSAKDIKKVKGLNAFVLNI